MQQDLSAAIDLDVKVTLANIRGRRKKELNATVATNHLLVLRCYSNNKLVFDSKTDIQRLSMVGKLDADGRKMIRSAPHEVLQLNRWRFAPGGAIPFQFEWRVGGTPRNVVLFHLFTNVKLP